MAQYLAGWYSGLLLPWVYIVHVFQPDRVCVRTVQTVLEALQAGRREAVFSEYRVAC